ncbi:tRNA lysidine(34) synthetase TilS [Gangjinia marincola]|uniref:tRNA(Ile)-lysidine synthase n=1 Tax=Gangjinia marincola TaxID=578463 RepID=A0ABP3XVC0_9FLAO
MLSAFRTHIEQNFSQLLEKEVIIAISGGLDSVVLAHLCKEAGVEVALAHCNFRLRGKESDEDEAFARGLAQELNLNIYTKGFDTKAYAEAHQLSTQMAARKLRYEWFDQLAQEIQASFILTAHHANDDLETFLINLSRGTGLTGLTGIPAQREMILRPLLPFSRKEILSYAKAQGFSWREDSSNASDDYLRNKIRHQVIPPLDQAAEGIIPAFQKTKEYVGEASALLGDYIKQVRTLVVTGKGDELSVDILRLQKFPNYESLLFELLKSLQPSKKDLLQLLHAQSGKYIVTPTHKILKNRGTLIALPRSRTTYYSTHITREQVEEGRFNLPVGYLTFNTCIERLDEGSNVAYFPLIKLSFPLTLSGWQQGDYFYPLGMNGTQKLSDFFINQKLSLWEKQEVLILRSAEDIIWVVNHRTDERYKVTAKDTELLRMSYHVE